MITWTLPQSEISIELKKHQRFLDGDVEQLVPNIQKNILRITDRDRLEEIKKDLKDYKNFLHDSHLTTDWLVEHLTEEYCKGKNCFRLSCCTDYVIKFETQYNDDIYFTSWETSLELCNYRANLLRVVNDLCEGGDYSVWFSSLYENADRKKLELLCQLLENTQGMVAEKKQMIELLAHNFAGFASDVVECIEIEPIETISSKEFDFKDVGTLAYPKSSLLADIVKNHGCLTLAKKFNKVLKK